MLYFSLVSQKTQISDCNNFKKIHVFYRAFGKVWINEAKNPSSDLKLQLEQR